MIGLGSDKNNVPPFASQGEDIVQLARPLVDPDCSSQVHGCQRVEPHQEGQRLHHMCPGLYQYDSCTVSLTESIVISESRNPSLKRMDGLTFDILITCFFQVVTIFNVFITYGDTFLPTASSYDELYYELVRCHHTFDNFHSMALRYSTVRILLIASLLTTNS